MKHKKRRNHSSLKNEAVQVSPNTNVSSSTPSSSDGSTETLRFSAALRYYLIITSAITGGIVMIVEILGAKMLAPYTGTSHFVWTAQIGVTLVSLAVGYAVGGWIADRVKSPAPLYFALLAAALFLTFSVLGCRVVSLACVRINLAVGSLMASAFLFFIPLCFLAMVPPFLVRSLTLSLTQVGTSVGRLSAISTIGSVVGTVAIGYAMIPFFSNSHIMFGTAIFLALMAVVYFFVWQRTWAFFAVIGLIAIVAIVFLGIRQPVLKLSSRFVEIYNTNSNFGLMQVVDEPMTGRRFYLNDLLTQNCYHIPTKQSTSMFTYMLYEMARCSVEEIKDVLCIGMGVGIVPMKFAEEGAAVDIVEINPKVIPLAKDFFDFKPEKFNITVGDGRTLVANAKKKYDVIVLDAFLGESPPSHLMTVEAFIGIRDMLKPGGALVINSFGSFSKDRNLFCSSFEKTLKAVFPTVKCFAVGESEANFYYTALLDSEATFVREPDFEDFPESLRKEAAALFDSDVSSIDERSILITDDYNPIDILDAKNRMYLRQYLTRTFLQ